MARFWLLLFLLVSHSLFALTTLHVSLSSDNDPGGSGDVGDLRYCINTMNTFLNSSLDDYEIVFDFPMTIQLEGILPIINNSASPVNITIGNSDPTKTVIIDGGNTYSGFFIPIGNVTIQNINFQHMWAKGGNGGNGISGGGGGLGAGAAVFIPQAFLNGSNPSVILKNVTMSNCAAIGGNGGDYQLLRTPTGDEGGGGGGGFAGNGGSIVTVTSGGATGGGGGGGFGGDGGDVHSSTADLNGGGGGGGGGLGSRATIGVITNSGQGGTDLSIGSPGNGFGLNITAGAGAGGFVGGIRAGGGGGGNQSGLSATGGGGGGSNGFDGLTPQGNTPPLHMQSITPSGGAGGDGGGGGGGAVVISNPTNNIDGHAAGGGYGGGGGGAAGTGFYDSNYTVEGGLGGIGGGGGGGGTNPSGTTSANGGNALGGGGGGGGGPSNGSNAIGGSDVGKLGGGSGGLGADNIGNAYGGGGGGGGSGLGAGVFVDSNLNLTIQALSGVATSFSTINNAVQGGSPGNANGGGGTDGTNGSSLGESIFLRTGSSLTLMSQDANDSLTLGNEVSFVDDTVFGAGGTSVFVRGNGKIIYNGNSDYYGTVMINNANFKVNGTISQANVMVCRNSGFSLQRGTLSGTGTLTGNVTANSGTIYPDAGGTLTLGSLHLNSESVGTLGSLVHIDIDGSGSSLVSVTGNATLAGTVEINLDASAVPGQYTLLTASSITGTFDAVTFTGATPTYTLSYLPVGAPTRVELDFTGYTSVDIPATVNGSSIINPAVVCCGRPVILGPLPVSGPGTTVYTVINQTGDVRCQIGQTQFQTYLKMHGSNGACTISGTKDGIVSNPLTVSVS